MCSIPRLTSTHGTMRTLAEKSIDAPFELSSFDHIEVRHGDARDLSNLDDESIDLICTHPPYGPAIRYTHAIEGDLSLLLTRRDFLDAIRQVVAEFYRVLKLGGYSAVLIGDYRKDGLIEPLGFDVFRVFRDEPGFRPVEIIIKKQHQDSSTEFYYDKKTVLRYRIAHEYLLIFRKDPTNVPS